MMRSLRSAALALSLWLLAGCALLPASSDDPTPPASFSPSGPSTPAEGERVTGNGKVVTEERQVSGFERVSFRGAAELIVEQGDAESLSIEAEENLLPLLVSEVAGGTLNLAVRSNSSISATRPIVYHLQVRRLSGLEASGAGKVTATGLETARLTADVSGAMRAVLTGRADEQDITVSGTSGFDGGALSGRAARVDASGTADVTVNVREELSAEASGTARVAYLGNPQVDSDTSGLGRVVPA